MAALEILNTIRPTSGIIMSKHEQNYTFECDTIIKSIGSYELLTTTVLSCIIKKLKTIDIKYGYDYHLYVISWEFIPDHHLDIFIDNEVPYKLKYSTKIDTENEYFIDYNYFYEFDYTDSAIQIFIKLFNEKTLLLKQWTGICNDISPDGWKWVK